MHIPDGYLSPATCAALYAAAAPFWIGAARRVRRLAAARSFPLVSLAAAFSFVIMMFNLPLPGGTTGHATGVAVSAIVLGPWASIVATSVALLVQALFFGDGGITALGANCFNMAIVGSLVATASYRLVAAGATLESRRRTVAAGLAGYLAVNAAALCAAIEFGLQPLLYRDATGAPLYAPYPLAVAVPAMMIGHLTFAGLAELVLTVGIVGFLQRSEPRLLAATASGAGGIDLRPATLRPLWIGLGVLLVATPLGLLAAGTAWGEWRGPEFADPARRAAIAAATRQAPLPAATPAGMARLSSIWSAPLPDYAPSFLRSAKVGYLLSAMFGTGLILLAFSAARAVARRRR